MRIFKIYNRSLKQFEIWHSTFKMGYLHLIRHGTTEWNKKKRYMGQTDVPLCYEGFLQARHLADYFSENDNSKVDYIVSSPLKRSLETASVISRVHKLPVEIDEGLAEAHFGRWEGMTFKEIEEACPEEALHWINNPSLAYIPGAENFDVFQSRVLKTFKELENKARNCNIIVVTHGGPLRFYLGSCLGMDDPSDYLSLDIPQGSVSRIMCNEITITLDSFAYTEHLFLGKSEVNS